MQANSDKLGNISETMLITVWARAVETQRNGGLLYDPIAANIIKQIDYDFSVFKRAKMSQVGCCIRSRIIDKQTLVFIEKHPDAVVIQLGAGLDTRYHRLGCPDITHWYDVDLPEAIDIRQKLCPIHHKNSLVALSLLDEAWVDMVQVHHKPVLIILEGVLMYFEETQVRHFFNMLCSRFEHASVLFDMLVYVAKGNATYHDAVKNTKQKVAFKWSLLDSYDMQEWHGKIHVVEELYMSDYAGKRFPWWWRLICKTRWGYKRFNQRMLRLEIAKQPE